MGFVKRASITSSRMSSARLSIREANVNRTLFGNLDVTGSSQVQLRGRIPARSVVIPGVRQREFPAGTFGVPCALIIGQRSESTDRKTSLNDALREYGVSA